MTSRTGSARRIWGIWRKLVELRLDIERDGWLSLARGGLGQVSYETGGSKWKSQCRKIVPLSPYVEEPLNSEVIKSFVPEQRSRKCFSNFEILCSMYICMNIPCTFRIFMYMAMVQSVCKLFFFDWETWHWETPVKEQHRICFKFFIFILLYNVRPPVLISLNYMSKNKIIWFMY